MHINEKSLQHSIHRVNYMLAYQPVFYYGLKRVGVRDLKECYNGLSANSSHQVVLYYDNIVLLKPQSDIRLQPLCDLSATDNLHQSQRSQQGPRSVPARLQRSRRLIGDLVATKSVAARFLCLHKRLAATDLVADRSRQSRRPVPDQSPTSRRPIAD